MEPAILAAQIASMRRVQRAMIVALAFSIVLGLSGVVFLFRLRLIAQTQLATLQASLGGIGDESIALDVPIRRDVPIDTTVQVTKTISVPISTTVAIDTVVTIPIEVPLLGVQQVRVPIKTTVPVKAVVPIVLNETIPIRTVVPLDFTVPIDIPLAQTPLKPYLEQLVRAITALRGQL